MFTCKESIWKLSVLLQYTFPALLLLSDQIQTGMAPTVLIVNIAAGLVSQIILAFSVRRNVLTICDQSVGSDTIPTIHGLRSISMGWVILGHTCIVIFKYSGWRQ